MRAFPISLILDTCCFFISATLWAGRCNNRFMSRLLLSWDIRCFYTQPRDALELSKFIMSFYREWQVLVREKSSSAICSGAYVARGWVIFIGQALLSLAFGRSPGRGGNPTA